MINEKRLAENFAALEKFSLPGEGITRLAFSDQDWAARDFIRQKMKQAGLAVREDAFGNLFGRKEGSQANLPPVSLGSHIDSVPSGGNFDGVVGVLAALEVIESMNEDGFVPPHPIEIIVFMAEESSRFGLATLGSKVMLGEIDSQKLKTLKDKEGQTLYEILAARQLKPAEIETAKLADSPKAFLEIHIEQGKVLEHKEIPLGIVTGIAAPTRLELILQGHADHSGATPMGMRQDALCAAAEIILAVEKLAGQSEQACVGTVGVIQASPGVMNVIPGQVKLGIDLRSIYAEAKTALKLQVEKSIAEICQRRQINYEITILADDKPVQLESKMVDFLAEICAEEKVKYLKMPSGAGHDAMHMAQLCPTGMLFIPCQAGISHHKDEFAALADIVAGTKILSAAVRKLAHKDCLL